MVMDADPTNQFTLEATAAAWDAGADAWDEFVESGADYYRTQVHGPGLLAACGEVYGVPVLDIGCGQGWFTRQLAGRGAHPVGIDISEKLLEIGRKREAADPLGIEYHCLPTERVAERWSQGDFDTVTACMSIPAMPEPYRAMQGAAQVLRAGGRFVFSIPNPVTATPYREWERKPTGEKGPLKIDRYFESGSQTVAWEMKRLKYSWGTPFWHLTLAEWTEMSADVGFVIQRIHEPRPTPEQVARLPDLDDCYRLPYFLIFECARL